MSGFHVVLLAAIAWYLTAGLPGRAPAADLYSLEARVMAVEARLREITTFRPAEPAPPVGGTEALRQRIQTLELSLVEMQNALKHLRKDVDDLKKAGKRP